VSLKEGQKVELHKAAGQMHLQPGRPGLQFLLYDLQGFNQFHVYP
jgi:hypothetical protein